MRADTVQEVSARPLSSTFYVPVNNITTFREDEDKLKKVVVCSAFIWKLADSIAEKENLVAKSMCLPIEIFNVPVGEALIDQGCTRSLMRQSAFEKLHVNVQNKLCKVRN